MAAPWFARAASGTPVMNLWLRALGAKIGRGVWCPTPGLLFLNTSCPGGGLPPADGGQWIANGLVTFRDSPAQAYLNIARSGSVIKVKAIALATPPPSPN